MKTNKQYKLGIVTGSFDILHPGYIKLFKEAGEMCECVLVALNVNGKRKPIFSIKERISTLKAIRWIDKIETYSNEDELFQLLKKHSPHVRILGSDYVGKSTYTGSNLGQEVYYHDRESHKWSTTKVINTIAKQKQEEQEKGS